MSSPTKKGTKSRPQMSDIANIAGVSKSTVSRALADSPLVNQATKDLVRKIAREQNYRLNVAARNFRLKESLTIGVILPSAEGDGADWRLSDPFFLEMLGALADAADQRGHQLLVPRSTPQEHEWIQSYAGKGTTDGLILIGQGSQHEAINELAKNYPALAVWGAQIDEAQRYSIVGTDNAKGGFRAADYLLKQGRRHIAFFGHRNLPEIEQRYQGYLAAHKEHGVDANPDLMINEDRLEISAEESLRTCLGSGGVMDAIFASNDIQAMAAIRALKKMGLSVPDDIAVIGYDDINLAKDYNPSLTTIRQDRVQAGELLVDIVLERYEGRSTHSTILDPELMIRESA